MWNTDTPVFGDCFRGLALQIPPCVLLLILTPFEFLHVANKKPIPWSFVSVTRVVLALLASTIHAVQSLILLNTESDVAVVTLIASLSLASAFLWSSCLLLRARRMGKVRCGTVWIFVASSASTAAVQEYAVLNEMAHGHVSWSEDVSTPYYLPVMILLLIFCSLSDHESLGDKEKKSSPRETCSFPAFFLFLWVDRIAFTGWSTLLNVSDLFPLLPENEAHHVGSLLWTKMGRIEQTQDTSLWIQNHVTLALMQTFRGHLLHSAMWKLITDMSEFLKPLLLKWLLNFLMDPNEWQWHGYLVSALILMSALTSNISQALYTDSAMSLGIRMRTALRKCIYQKSLTISNTSKNVHTSGEIVNLMSVDAERFRILMEYIHSSWSCILQISIAVILLYHELGASAMSGVVILFLLMMFHIRISSVMERHQKQQMSRKDERVRMINEVLSGIRIIKLYAWEKAFIDMIRHVRRKELSFVWINICLFNMRMAVSVATPVTITLATFACYVLSDSGNVLTPSNVFVSLAYFNIVRVSLADLPRVFNYLVAVRVSLRRLQQFFSSPDQPKYVQHHEDGGQDAILIQKASLSHGEEPLSADFKLVDLNLKIPTGSLTAIIGPVGSGKSSLLSALLGDMQLNGGRVSICNNVQKIAYVPQQAWILNESLKQNILFGEAWNEEKYNLIIQLCQLGRDIDLLPDRDETEIGEKGINLSGGQKQRLSIARAAYSDADLYFFDDPLSAVDANVSKRLFNLIISSETGYLKDKTRLLVTSGVSYLPSVDQIVIMKDGRIHESGSFQDLISLDGKFSAFMEEFASTVSPSQPGIRSALIHGECQPLESSDESYKQKDGLVKMCAKGKLIQEEERQVDGLKFEIFLKYFKGMNSLLPMIAGSSLLYGVCDSSAKYWLSHWSDDEMNRIKRLNNTGMGEYEDTRMWTVNERMAIYASLGLAESACLLMASFALAMATTRAAHRLHQNLLHRILRSPMSFFEQTPIGRITNRFSKDMDSIDTALYDAFCFFMFLTAELITMTALVLITIPTLVYGLIPLIMVLVVIQRLYMQTARQMRRLEATTTSIIHSDISETLSGITSIRAYVSEQRFTRNSDHNLDQNQICSFALSDLNQWRSMRLEFCSNLTVFAAALIAVRNRGVMDPGLTGFALTYAFMLSKSLNTLVRSACVLETEAVSVERVLQYSEDIGQEADWESNGKPPSDWPKQGSIQFQNYATRYRSGMDLVLKNITADIRAGEKVGIVGRTGAGKSTITLALFRILEASEGSILIDGVDVSHIGLHDLRSKLTIIPQDPVIFSGTLRSNLDPFQRLPDEDLWQCIESCHLKPFVRELQLGLDHEVTEGGGNLSVGQRQLLCLGRALLRNSKILVLDEATASLDLQTDSLVQSTIREQFAHCTILTIAHRINTILDSDRVLVIDKGTLHEYDTPQNLMQSKGSIFESFVRDAGLSCD